MRAAVFVLVAALGGCGGAYDGYVCGGVRHLWGPVELFLEGVVVQRDGEETTLALDAPVRAGDDLALWVSAVTPHYLYVVNLAPDGSSDVVWPHDVPQVVDGSMRIPEQSWFRLAGQAGPEVVALVATRDHIPLSARGREILVAIVKQEASRSDLAKLQAAHPPGFFADGHATMGLRARGLRPHGHGARVGATDERAVLLIDLDHRPR
jgi:hypothetical protein